jgi:hypothetical protein
VQVIYNFLGGNDGNEFNAGLGDHDFYYSADFPWRRHGCRRQFADPWTLPCDNGVVFCSIPEMQTMGTQAGRGEIHSEEQNSNGKKVREEDAMVLAGIVITLAGFLIAFAGLGAASSVGVRMVMALAGIAVSITGIFGFINRAYLKTAIWKK